MHRIVLFVAATAAVGCTPFRITQEIDETVSTSFDISGPCEGQGSEGDVVYTKSMETVGGVELCRIDVDWAGEVVDLEEVRERLGDEFDVDDIALLDVSIASILIEVTDLDLLDADGEALSAPSATVDTTFSLAGIEAFTLANADLDSLLTQPVQAEASDALIARMEEALMSGESVSGESDAVLRVPMSELEPLQSAPGPVNLEMDIRAEITLGIGIRGPQIRL